MSSSALLQTWCQLIRDGIAIAGPPCETFSSATGEDVPGMKHPPRQVRDNQNLWGLPNLKSMEIEQVAVGHLAAPGYVHYPLHFLARWSPSCHGAPY